MVFPTAGKKKEQKKNDMNGASKSKSTMSSCEGEGRGDDEEVTTIAAFQSSRWLLSKEIHHLARVLAVLKGVVIF